MPRTRRDFLQTTAGFAAGMIGMTAAGETPASQLQTSPAPGKGTVASGIAMSSEMPCVQVPTMKFGGAEIGRLVLGCNPMNGGAHFNATYSVLMREWFTQERAVQMMHYATQHGINAFNYSNKGRCPENWVQFLSEGGGMHLIAGDSSDDDPVTVVKKLKPHSLHRQGEVVDVAFREKKMNDVREWCKRVRDTGTTVGVATHKPEVIAFIEEQGWDVDYYCGCVYHRTRTDDEWRKVLNGELMEMSREIYIAERSAADV